MRSCGEVPAGALSPVSVGTGCSYEETGKIPASVGLTDLLKVGHPGTHWPHHRHRVNARLVALVYFPSQLACCYLEYISVHYGAKW